MDIKILRMLCIHLQLRKLYLSLILIVPVACATLQPGSSRLDTYELESQAHRIAWSNTCKALVAEHEQAECLLNYFAGEISYQQTKVSHLSDDDQKIIMERAAFLAQGYQVSELALEQCLSSYELGTALLNAVSYLEAKSNGNLNDQKANESCLEQPDDKVIYSGGLKGKR